MPTLTSVIDTNIPNTLGSAGHVLTVNSGGSAAEWAAAGGGASAYTIDTKTDNYTAVAGDLGKLIHFTQIGADKTLTLTAAATLGAGWFCYVRYSGIHSGPTYKIIIDPNGSETIDGETTRNMRDGQTFQIVCDGSNFHILSSDDSRAFSHNVFYGGVGQTGATLAQPDASGSYAIALGGAALSSGTGSVALGYNSKATGSHSFAGPQSTATGLYSVSLGNSSPAGSTNGARGSGSIAIGQTVSNASGSLAIGQYANATGANASAIGHSLASGSHSFAAGITSNSSSYGATGANSVAMGYLSKCSGSYSTAIGRQAVNASNNSVALGVGGVDIASGGNYHVGIGTGVSIDTDYNAIGIGRSVTINHDFATAIGYQAISSVKGQHSYSSSYFSGGGTAGRGNGCTYVLYAEGTDATPQVMTTTKTTAAADNQIAAPTNDTCIMFSGTIVAMQSGAQDQGGWEIKGLLKNDGGTTTLVNSNVQTFAEGNGWAVALSADNTNNALKVQVTGEASHNIRWVANIQTSEVTYA